MKALSAAISNLDAQTLTAFETSGQLVMSVDGETFTLETEDLVVSRTGLSGWQVETEDGLTVALDTQLDEALIAEGIAREVVNRIQNMRKEADFDVTDRIQTTVSGDGTVEQVVLAQVEYISVETLTDHLTTKNPAVFDFRKDWDINGHPVTVTITRIHS